MREFRVTRCCYVMLSALRCLKKAVRSGWRIEWIKHDPDWTALRGLKRVYRPGSVNALDGFRSPVGLRVNILMLIEC